MDHPIIRQIERSGHHKPIKKVTTSKQGEYWDPIEWMKEQNKKRP